MNEPQQQKSVSAKTLRLAAWAMIAYLILPNFWAGLWIAYYYTDSWLIFGLGSLFGLLGGLAEIYAFMVFRDMLRRNLGYDRITRHLNALVILYATVLPLMPLMMLKGTVGIIAIGASVLIVAVGGIPLLWMGLAILNEGPDLWGLRKVFAIMAIITGISMLTVIGLFLFGGLTFLVLVVLIIIYLFRAANEQESAAVGE